VVLAIGASAGNLLTVESFQVSSVLNAIPNTAGAVTSSNIQSGVTINFADGSASTPSITNDGDTNTGIFFPAADTIAFAEGGVESMRISAAGDITLGANTIPDSAKVTVVGAKTLSSGIPQQQLNVYDSTALATGTGGAISFSANYIGSSPTTMGSIEGVRENGTSGNYAGNLVFKTRANGANNNEVMRINSAGYVTTPYQPAFRAYTTSGTYPTTGGNTVNFNNVQTNISSSFATSGGNAYKRFTAPVAGVYLFAAALMAQDGTGRLYWGIYKNGGNIAQTGGTSTNYGNFTTSIVVDMAANDYVEVVIQSGTLYGASTVENYFSGYLLG
jgi:hypothetical protein